MDEFVRNAITGRTEYEDRMAIIAAIEIARKVLVNEHEKNTFSMQYGSIAINRILQS